MRYLGLLQTPKLKTENRKTMVGSTKGLKNIQSQKIFISFSLFLVLIQRSFFRRFQGLRSWRLSNVLKKRRKKYALSSSYVPRVSLSFSPDFYFYHLFSENFEKKFVVNETKNMRFVSSFKSVFGFPEVLSLPPPTC